MNEYGWIAVFFVVSAAAWEILHRMVPNQARRRAAMDLARAAHVDRMRLAYAQSRKQMQTELDASLTAFGITEKA